MTCADNKIIQSKTYVNHYSPMVATTLKSPLAIRSISSSICWSDDDGELRTEYEEYVFGVGVDEADGSGLCDAVDCTGGRRENSDGEGDRKDRY